MKPRINCSVFRRPRICNLDFIIKITFPSMSRFRGKYKPAFIYSILRLSTLRSMPCRKWTKVQCKQMCKITFITVPLLCCKQMVKYHWCQIPCAICTYPKACSSMLYDPNHYARENAVAKDLLFWCVQCHSGGIHLHQKKKKNKKKVHKDLCFKCFNYRKAVQSWQFLALNTTKTTL